MTTKHLFIFDLDETIGHFVNLSHIWNLYQYKTQKQFNTLLDKYPEYFRPNIFKVLKLIINKREKDSSIKLIMYTNKQDRTKTLDWPMKIHNYLIKKLFPPTSYYSGFKRKTKVFDLIIGTYWNVKYKKYREDEHKRYTDLLYAKELKMNKKTKCYFYDDQTHEHMRHPQIIYHRVTLYTGLLTSKEIISRLTGLSKQDKKYLTLKINKTISDYQSYNESKVYSYSPTKRQKSKSKHRKTQKRKYINDLVKVTKKHLRKIS